MNELIHIGQATIGPGAVRTVNARDLHSFLGVGKDFSTWIKDRVEQYGFVEGRDFACAPAAGASSVRSPVSGSENRGGQNRVDYHVALDMAKELAMVERTEKGKQARVYFIECERRAGAPAALNLSRMDLLQLAMDAERARLALEDKVAGDAPKVEFAESVRNMDGTCKLEHIAKTLGWGRNRFIDRLRDDKVLLHDRTPLQKYIDRGYFRVVEQAPWRDSKGAQHPAFTTMVTGAGQVWLAKRYAHGKVAA